MQPSLFPVQNSQKWTVSRLTFYIRKLLEENETLQDVWVQGEVSNLSRPASGHIYFTLKDSSAALKCVMWKQSAMRLGISLQDGMEVEVHGKIGVYEVSGQFTVGRDRAVVQVYLDDTKLGGPVDCYATKLDVSGPVALGTRELTAGAHTLVIEVTGANEKARDLYQVGLDYIKLKPTR